jgi:hypothetical protein
MSKKSGKIQKGSLQIDAVDIGVLHAHVIDVLKHQSACKQMRVS